jgi:SAM-dependent methyltransferase
VAEGPLERVLLATNVVPRPLVESMLGMLLVRVVMTGTRAGVFDALEERPATTAEVARRCGLDPAAADGLLCALHGARYLRRTPDGAWANTRMTSRWLTRASPDSLRENILFRYEEWKLVEHFDEYVRSGTPLDIHTAAGGHAFWRRYMRGMRALARLAAAELAARVPVPPDATRVLDVGGAHGEYVVELCRRHPRLTAEILDLEPAAAVGREMVAAAGMSDRVRFRAGDLRDGDLGEGFDLCLLFNVLHHFAPAQNRSTLAAVARALRPGGLVVVCEAFRSDGRRRPGQLEGLLGFYFQVTSGATIPTLADLEGWFAAAGLTMRSEVGLRRAPGAKVVIGERP